MTFEAGRKKQILVLQPKGKPLYDDSQSFGLKMLQSMGWQKGSGLGRNQQGNLNFIQVRYRNNSNGLGFDALKDNQWTETENSFDSLLKNLNSQSNSNSNSSDEVDQKKGPKSLEEMSKKSRARVHYKKFTKGKDVYKYSEKDLANILGKKSLKEVEKKEEEVKEEIEEEEKPETYKSDLIVNTGISITDYFKQKKKEKTENGCETSRKSKLDPSDPEINEEQPEKLKKRKKKDKTKEWEVEEAPIEENSTELPCEDTNEVKKKKKKRKRESVDVVEEPQEPEIPKKKKKSKKSVEETPTEVMDEPVTKKKKKNDSSTKLDVSSNIPESTNVKSKTNDNDPDRPRGANALYATDVILIPSHVAQKMSSVIINNFNNSNLGNIVGYGMTDDIEIKVVETKMGENKGSNDKYALYNMDKITKPRINTRKILTKIKKTKKSIQVI